MTTRADILRAIRAAQNGEEQRLAVLALDAFDREVASRHTAARELDLTDTVIRERMMPTAVHEHSTVATDWLGEVTASAPEDAAQRVIAEATLWYGRTPDMVRQDADEFVEQARGKARQVTAAYGEDSLALQRSFLEYVAYLNREAASGLDQVQQLVDSFEKPKQTPLPQDVFDNFQPPVHPINEGVTGTETSERAPLIQEIMQGDGYGQGPEKPGGHSTSFDGSGGYSEVPAEDTEPKRTAALTLDDYREQFAKEAAADARRADPKATTTSGSSKEAASGLDQVQQVVDSFENPKPTPEPTDVAFPWTMSEDEYEQDHPGQKAFAARQRLVAALMSKDPAQLTDAERGEILAYANAVSGKKAAIKSGRAGLTREAVEKVADQWTAPHEVPGGQVANSPATTPESTSGSYADGYAEGKSDALAGDAPTFADASSHAPEFVQGHTKGYADGIQQKQDHMPKDEPGSMGGMGAQSPMSDAMTNPYADPGGRAYARKVSSLVSTPESHEDADFSKGLKYARRWRPGTPLVTQGSPEFEGGLYAGISDNVEHQAAWVERHRVLAKRDQRFADRIDRHASYSTRVATRLGARVEGPYLRLEAATSTDLDTTAPNTSPSPVGDTPINGPGKVPPLAGQEDPAAEGGPAPYNGAPPYGSPVVPTGAGGQGRGASTTIDATIGGPMDQAAMERYRMHPTTLAFRQRVQASLLADRQKEKASV